jgi:hypothetical protein
LRRKGDFSLNFLACITFKTQALPWPAYEGKYAKNTWWGGLADPLPYPAVFAGSMLSKGFGKLSMIGFLLLHYLYLVLDLDLGYSCRLNY